MIVSLALWLGCIVIGLALVAWYGRRDAEMARALDQRLARGELEFDEYRARRARLGT